MKKIVVAMICLLACLGVGGCQFQPPTPESLIKPPISNQEKVKQKQMITGLLNHGEHLTVPFEMENPTAFVMVDVDEDREDEILAFYQNSDKSFKLGFVILENDGNDDWHIAHRVESFGTAVDYFQLVDLDGVGSKELLFGVNTGTNKELHIYCLDNQQVTEVGQVKYDKLAIGAFEQGLQNDIIAVTSDLNEIPAKSKMTIYHLSDDQLSTIFEDNFSGCCKGVLFAMVGRNTEGIYLTMEHMYQLTTVMLWTKEADGFVLAAEEALPYDYESIEKMTIFADINNDGVMEFSSIAPPMEVPVGKSYNNYVKVWQQWDDQSALITVHATLSNSTDGYEFSIPVEWLDQMGYSFRQEGNVEWIDFYDSGSREEWLPVFSIAAIDQATWNSRADTAEDWIKLGNHPKKNKVYIGKIYEETESQWGIDASHLIARLRIDGGK